MLPRTAAPLLLLLALAGGCGPTAGEIGQSVLWAAPLITLAAYGLAWLYARLWRSLVAELELDPVPVLVLVGLQVVTALVTLLAPELDGELVWIAFWLVGASYLTIAVPLVRLTIHLAPRNASWALLAPWLFFYPLALLLAAAGDATGDLVDLAILIWAAPGYGGWIAAPVALAALAEVLVRRSRARRPPPPPALPEARARTRR